MPMHPSVRSPVDEEVVHDSFHQLIAEQSRNDGLSDAFELQRLQRDLEEEERQGVVEITLDACLHAES